MPKRNAADAAHVTVGEAAELLGFSASTVQKLADDGSLVTVRTPGGHRRITRESLAHYQGRAAGEEPRGPSVLLVDDDPIALAFMQHLIGKHFPQCVVSTARDGMEAVLLLAQHQPGLVVTDLSMPHDGFRLVHLLRSRMEFSDIRVAVVSALSPAQIARRGGLPPQVAIFPKPLPMERFLGYMDAFVRHHAG